MKLIEAIQRVDRSDANSGYAGDEFFSDLMGQSVYLDVNADRIQCCNLFPWYCTDTWVGGMVYYLDDRPLAFGFQSARKSQETVKYVDTEVLKDAREYVSSLIHGDIIEPHLIDPDEEIGEDYTVAYREQLLTDRGYVDGRAVMYLKAETKAWLAANIEANAYGYTFPGDAKATYRESIIVVEYPDETREAIDIERFKMPYRLGETG